MKEPIRMPIACKCKSCRENVEKLERHLNHPFYQVVDEYTDEIKHQQILKGADKYEEPFDPDSWSIEELADHGMQELRDGQVYITGMRDRMRKLTNKITLLEYEKKELLLKMAEITQIVIALNGVSMSGGGASLVARLEKLLGVESIERNGGTGK